MSFPWMDGLMDGDMNGWREKETEKILKYIFNKMSQRHLRISRFISNDFLKI
mgnify:CR=1 FL=1